MNFIKYTLILAFATYANSLYGQNNGKNIGINTNDPKTNLDIRGDLRVVPDEISEGSTLTPLYRISSEGTQPGMHEIVKKESADDSRPFYEFDLFIPLTTERTNVDKFATNIPASQYILSVLNSNFIQQVDGNPAAVGNVTYELSGSGHVNKNPLKQVDAWIEDGYWYISAKYNSANSVTAYGDRAWVITLLAMDTKYSKIVDPNPNYVPDAIKEKVAISQDPRKAIKEGNQKGRHYDRYDNSNPQNPSSGDQSLRGDSFKLDNNMNGSAIEDPLKHFENN